MTRRLRRHERFELSLTLKDETFLRPPRETQRTWLLNRTMKEAGDDLLALDELARRFAPGAEPEALADRTHVELADEAIMEDWQIPLMRAMAEAACRPDAHVLEIGFGRGVASTMIQEQNVASHTIIECNESVVARFGPWRSTFPDRDIRLVEGLWQDAIGNLGLFDGIFFHTYPLNEAELIEYVIQSNTFAEHFFPTAAAHLRPGGYFSYMTNEIDSLGRGHQRALLRHFSSFCVSIQRHLPVPADVRDAWWSDSMAIVRAVK